MSVRLSAISSVDAIWRVIWRETMTQYDNRLLDDVAKLFTSAAGAAQGVRQEIEAIVKGQAERLISDLDLVSREEFEAVQAMAAKAREENEDLKARLEVLEAAISSQS
jgi:BMFP domain-containing protein YqiC